MQPLPLTLPRPVPVQRLRPPKKSIPQTPDERRRILQFVRHYVAEYNPVPPLPLMHLAEHADRVVQLLNCDPIYRNYIGVLINNEMWREIVAAVPFHRRLLLLPKCLRHEDKCQASFDEVGLVCQQCGLCSIRDLQTEAEQLGYAVLVAEGSALVTSLIQTGKIDAIVGVSCMNVLERAFSYMEAAAIPGVAVPLLQDDCADTNVDLDWVWDCIHLTSDDQTRRLDLSALREEIERWFEPAALDLVMGPADGETEQIARAWLVRAGKRWRPFLTVAAYQALRQMPGASLPDELRKLAVAIECFHKASLIHDDIEDNDPIRYGTKTLHEEYGVAVALNAGDLLIGEGYRLIGACAVSPARKAQMLLVAAEGQRQLCRGQGAELVWARRPQPLNPVQVLDIFRKKTAPAFDVALKLGILYAFGATDMGQGSEDQGRVGGGPGLYEDLAASLAAYSEALGIAYQIRDDLSDFNSPDERSDLHALRPNLLLAVAWEQARGEARTLLEAVWRREPPPGVSPEQIAQLYRELAADQRARVLLESYKEEAIRALRGLENANLKGLLRRILGKIFNHAEIKGWCRECQAQNAARKSDG